MSGCDYNETVVSSHTKLVSKNLPLSSKKKDLRSRKYKADRKRFKSIEGGNQSRLTNYYKFLNDLEIMIDKNKYLNETIKNILQDSEKKSNDDSNGQQTRSVLNILMKAAKENSNKKKQGYRYEDVIKLFAMYVKMLGGTLLYETIHKNLPTCFPSPSSINNYLRDYGPIVTEGKLRSVELYQYLKDKQAPLCVWLAEDATKITPRIQYDPGTNRICVPPG